LGRSFDERSHIYLGYALRVHGSIGGETREFLVDFAKVGSSYGRFYASTEFLRSTAFTAHPVCPLTDKNQARCVVLSVNA
jgi:hypothetical protein